MTKNLLPTITSAHWPDDIETVRSLFTEYMMSLGVDLSFQDVDTELVDIPGKYAPPAGIVLLAHDQMRNPVGCCALRPLAESGTCEMKRLHVRPQNRGHSTGRRLVNGVVSCARRMGYTRILLDTLASMHAAQSLYASIGFRSAEQYYSNPLPGTLYLGLDL